MYLVGICSDVIRFESVREIRWRARELNGASHALIRCSQLDLQVDKVFRVVGDQLKPRCEKLGCDDVSVVQVR